MIPFESHDIAQITCLELLDHDAVSVMPSKIRPIIGRTKHGPTIVLGK